MQIDPLSKVNLATQDKIVEYTAFEFRKHLKEKTEELSRRAYGGSWENIYGIPRGGLVVAVYLSHLLKLPIILNQQEVSRHTLVVDDIVDSGKTIEQFLNHHTFAIFMNEDLPEEARPSLFLTTKKSNQWIKFFWE